MELITVFAFDYRDAASNSWVRGPVYATLDAIQRLGGRRIGYSGRMVFREGISANGFAWRVPHGAPHPSEYRAGPETLY